MKVVYILRDLAIVGGIERIVSDKINYLSHVDGIEVHVVFLFSTAEREMVFPLDDKVHIHYLSFSISEPYRHSFFVRYFKKKEQQREISESLRNCIESIGADIVIYNCQSVDYVSNTYSNSKLIFESHVASQFLYKDFVHNKFFLWNIYHKLKIAYRYYQIKKNVDCVVCITNDDANDNWLGAKHLEVIPNFTKHCDKKEYNINSKIVIAAGRLSEQKRFSDAIAAWIPIAKKYPDWQLHIYGEGEQLDKLNSQISRFNLTEYVKILPFTDKLDLRFQESSFFLLSSLYEGFALVIAEAMMNGIPVVSYNCPYGPKDLVTDNGILVENGNVEKLSEAILRMIENPNERVVMSEKSYKNIQSYNQDSVMKQWISLFHKL